jgi:hypothetical protein
MARTVVPLVAGRLRHVERRLDVAERRLRELAQQLDQATEVLTRLVRVVAVQSRQSRRILDRLDERVKRVARDITRARTTDLRRMTAVERCLAALERRPG